MVKGIVRKLDELGRVTLPIEIRRTFNLSGGDRVGLRLDGHMIRVSKTITGMSRPMDGLGRIALPIEYRRTLSLAERQEVDIYLEGNDICVSKTVYGCSWCGSSEDLLEVNGHHICITCAAAITVAVANAVEE